MNKRNFIFVALFAIVVFAAAFFGYDYLSKNYTIEDNLSSSAEENSSEASEQETVTETETVMAPDFIVYDADGNPVSLSDFAGKPVVMNFWATWCGYCVKEMPEFEEAYKKYGDEVVFMMINVTGGNETKEKAMEFIEENGYTFPVYYDTDLSATYAYGAYSLPATGFVTKSGIFAGGQIGAMSGETLSYYIEQLMETE